jgi:uncharacterized protein YegP (UPF0339 family)
MTSIPENNNMQFVITQKNEKWHWELRRARGGVMAIGTQEYRTQEDALEAVCLFQKSCDAFIYDVLGNMLESQSVARFPKK